MPVRSTPLQRLLFHIQRQLGPDTIVHESALLVDLLSGDRREVDIVIRAKVGEHDVVVSVECREHRRKATVEWVEQMAMKHQSLPTSKLVLVSAKGFSRGAAVKAKGFGIEVCSMEEAATTDWRELLGEDRRLSFDLVGFRIVACGLVLAGDESAEHRAVPLIALFDQEGLPKGSLGEVVYDLTTRSAFCEKFLTHLNTLEDDSSFVGAGIRVRPPLFVSDEEDHLDEIAAVQIYFEVERVPSGVKLEAARYRGMPVASGQGKAIAGDFTFTLLKMPNGTQTGAFSLSDPVTGDIDTASLRAVGEGSPFKFITDRPLRSRGR
jgi:hypothetical protein